LQPLLSGPPTLAKDTLDLLCAWSCTSSKRFASWIFGYAHGHAGLFREGSHDVVPIPGCPIHHPRINQVVEVVEQVSLQNSTLS